MASKLTGFLRRLAGGMGGGADAAAAVEYKGYEIRPDPRREGSRWLTAGVIEKPFEDGVREHRFVRAETHGSKDEADAFSILKGKQIVDDLGDSIFKGVKAQGEGN